MKNFLYALCGITLVCLFSFCSAEDPELEETANDLQSEDRILTDFTPEKEEEYSQEDEDEDELQVEVTLVLPPLFKDPNAPVLQINELRTEYSGGQSRAEFIEFRANEDLNLAGMRVLIASNNLNPVVYEFLPVEIKEYEYVVLHLRTLSAESKDEYGEKKDESGGRDSSPVSRDFWVPGNKELLRKTDIIYVLDKDDNVIDAVMISEKPDSEWSKSYFTETAELLFNRGAWKSSDGTIPSPMEAVSTSSIGSALTKSISRDETTAFTRTASDWYVTSQGGISPGTRNNPRD